MVENDDDDFTFPTTVVAATVVPEERGDVVIDTAVATPAAGLPGFAAPSRLWPFAAPMIGATPTAASVVKEEQDEAPAASTRRDDEERATVVDDEDRMDMLWDDTAAAKNTAPASTKSGGRANPEHPAAAAKPAEDERAAAVAEQERMDLLWESFNEELLLLRRARSKSGKQNGPEPDWYLCPSSTSDAESEEASAVSSPGRARYGCAPTMLRASSRAGGAGQFYGSPRRRSRGGGWALLLRLFRRLFAVDKAAPPRRHSVYVP